MTKAKSRAAWVKAWMREVGYLYRIYQCKADPEVFVKLKKHIYGLEEVIEEIGDLMESEGVWEGSP